MSRPGSNNQQRFIKQYASSVIDFSSQYGSENPRSVSYSISNIVGEPRIFPSYGDFTQAAVFRTYGTWWENMTFSEPNSIRPRNPCEKGRPIPLPLKNDCSRWEVLWECQSPEENRPNPPHESRMFAPALSSSMHLTRIIRLEFCSTHLHYYTEIDAVELTGTSVQYLSSSVDWPDLLFQNLSISDNEPNHEEPRSGGDPSNGYFDLLPHELIRYIFSFLPLPDLCRCGIVCKLFHDMSYDPSQFSVIDLSSSWHIANDNALNSILAHCWFGPDGMEDDSKPPPVPQVQVLNLSWCGGGGIMSQNSLVNFMEKCGSNALTRLTCSSSPTVSDDALQRIVTYCPSLNHLNLQSCNSLTPEGLRRLHHLTKLIHLNLYRTKIDDAGIICTVHSNPNLHYLNLGSCPKIADYDRVLQEISEHCTEMKSIDCWRAKTLTSFGLECLVSNCDQLEDLDFGWTLATKCPKLRQLYVTANRTISDIEIHTFAEYCPNLEKLDILGTRLVTVPSVHQLLQTCRKLHFLDVSFCMEFSEQVVQSLETQFPHVSIKRSYQDET